MKTKFDEVQALIAKLSAVVDAIGEEALGNNDQAGQ
jgi:hypothetical protein